MPYARMLTRCSGNAQLPALSNYYGLGTTARRHIYMTVTSCFTMGAHAATKVKQSQSTFHTIQFNMMVADVSAPNMKMQDLPG